MENTQLYFPDLYLPEYDLFVEIKGYFGCEAERQKIELFKKQYGFKLLLIQSDDYKKYFLDKNNFEEFKNNLIKIRN